MIAPQGFFQKPKTDMADEIENEYLVNLGIIGSLTPLQKLRIHPNHTVSLHSNKNTWTSLVRWWFGDSRYRTIQYVKVAVGGGIEMHKRLVECGNLDQASLFGEALRKAVHGIESLQKTYAGDIQVNNQLEVIKKNTQHYIYNHVSYESAFL